MKKLLLSILIVASLLSCSNNDDDQSSVSANSKEEISMKNIDGTVVTEIPTAAFEKIISNLKKANQNDKVKALISQYENDNGTTKLISPVAKSISMTAKSISMTAKSTAQITFQYRAHVEGIPSEGYGWMPWYILGTPVGTTEESRRLEALQFSNGSYITGFRAQAHVQGKGWLPEVGLGDIVGTTGEKRRAEAFIIQVPATFATQVLYRVYVQSIGWMPYVNNGEIAGTVGQSLRVEAFQLNMVVIE